jgi:hypothetical protein
VLVPTLQRRRRPTEDLHVKEPVGFAFPAGYYLVFRNKDGTWPEPTHHPVAWVETRPEQKETP